MKSLKLLVKLCLTVSLLVLSSCGHMQIQDVRPTIRLPGSGDCFGVHVLSHKEVRLPKIQCDEFMKRGVFFSVEDWQKQRYDIQKNCQLAQCKKLVGAFDQLFLVIDQYSKKLP